MPYVKISATVNDGTPRMLGRVHLEDPEHAHHNVAGLLRQLADAIESDNADMILDDHPEALPVDPPDES